MRLFLLFLSFIFLISANKPPISTYDIKTAVEKNIIHFKAIGNPVSPHYYQPISIKITNKTNKYIVLKIPNGQRFVSDSTEIQDIIITREDMIALRPFQSLEKKLFGMCIQENNAASSERDTFHLGEMASENLVKLTSEIEKNNSFNTIGQYAVWSLTDKYPIEKIDGFDETNSHYYQKYVSDLLGLPYPELKPSKYKTYYQKTISKHSSLVGKFKYNIHKNSNITMGLFNEQNIIVRELYNNPNQEAGEHEFKYAFDMETYNDPVYYIRLIINGEVMVNLKMEPKRS